MKSNYMQYNRNYNQNARNSYRSSRDGIYILKIVVSLFLIIISILAIYIVVRRVMNIKMLEKINLKEEVHDSLNITTDTNSGTSFFVTDDKGLKFRKEDKSFAREEWIEKNGELFYFDTAGYGLNGELKKEGQVYTFENGKLKNIKRDTSYVSRAKDELFSSIESAQYLVWLEDDEKEGNFYPIKYRQYSDDSEDYLGSYADKQYSSPNMIKIYLSDIYYLASGKGPSYTGHLYRMRPNAIHKEEIGTNVTGYIVLSEDIVYYCDGERVIKAKNWKNVMLKLPDNEELNEEGDIVEKISTTSTIPVINDQGEEFSIDINDLPKPDEEIKIISDETNTDSKIASSEIKVEVGVGPISNTGRSVVKEEIPEIGVGPQVVEVEAPR